MVAMLGQFLRVPRNFEIFHDGLFLTGTYEGRRYRSKDFRYQPEIWLDDAQ